MWAAEIIRAGAELEGSHLDIRAAAVKVYMDDYEGLDFATWAKRIIKEKSGRAVPEDFRQVEQIIRHTEGLSMTLSGGFSQSEARKAHQETKSAFWDLRDVAKKGWRQVKEALFDSPAGEAIALAVEKLARVLKRERLSKVAASRQNERDADIVDTFEHTTEDRFSSPPNQIVSKNLSP